MEIVTKIQLPLFKGFLDHEVFLLERLDEEFCSNEEFYKEKFGDNITSDDLTFDDERYQHDVCLQAIERFRTIITSNYPGLLHDIEYSALVSPPYYQYNTDRMYVNVTLCNDWRNIILDFMRVNQDWLAERIHKDWTSRSGFTSYINNVYENWVDEMNQVVVDSRYVSKMMGYMARKAREDAEEYVNGAMEEVEFGEYVRFIGKD